MQDDADRLAFQAIDWMDFAVVETITFPEDDVLVSSVGIVNHHVESGYGQLTQPQQNVSASSTANVRYGSSSFGSINNGMSNSNGGFGSSILRGNVPPPPPPSSHEDMEMDSDDMDVEDINSSHQQHKVARYDIPNNCDVEDDDDMQDIKVYSDLHCCLYYCN